MINKQRNPIVTAIPSPSKNFFPEDIIMNRIMPEVSRHAKYIQASIIVEYHLNLIKPMFDVQ
jgi:hypothetical protein